MDKTDWGKIIEDKIADAKKRGSRKRGWVKLDNSWLTSSINYRMELGEIAVFTKLMVMADAFGPVAGLISDNDFRPMPRGYLAHQACCPLDVFERTIKKGIADDSIFENSHGIFLTHFDDYQFTEYDRQKPSRDAKREREKQELISGQGIEKSIKIARGELEALPRNKKLCQEELDRRGIDWR